MGWMEAADEGGRAVGGVAGADGVAGAAGEVAR
jgi:hypothetical protein